MVASVRDLIIAANAGQSGGRGGSALESFLGALNQRQQSVDPLSTAVKLAEIKKFQMEMENQKTIQRERNQMQKVMDKAVKEGKVTKSVVIDDKGVKTTYSGKEAGAMVSPEALDALQSGDVERIKREFPLGVPQKLVNAAIREGVRVKTKEEKAKTRKENIDLAAKTVVQDINRGIKILEKNMDQFGPTTAAGPIGMFMKFIPASDAHTVEKFAESVKSNISIDRLQAMREASPTGGALGQIPVQQQRYLMQLLGSLEIEQKPKVLADNMKRIYNIYNDIIHGEGNGPERYRLSFDQTGREVEGGADWNGVSSIVGGSEEDTKDAESRYNELIEGGYTEEEAYGILQEEGY